MRGGQAGRMKRTATGRGAAGRFALHRVRFLAWGLIAVLLLGFGGCAGLKRPAVEKRHYDFRPARAEAATAPQGAPNLRLRRVRVSPLCGGREMVFRSGDAAFASDYYNTWFVPPADMLTQSLRQWLDRSGLFAHVLDEASLAGARLSLECTANTLYGDFSGDRPEAVAELQFLLLDEGTGHNEILFTGNYAERAALDSEAPQALAVGLRSALAAIYARLEADLARLPVLRPADE